LKSLVGENRHTLERENYRSITQAEAAEKLDVSDKYIREAKKIQRQNPEHFQRIKSGEFSIQQVKRELNPLNRLRHLTKSTRSKLWKLIFWVLKSLRLT